MADNSWKEGSYDKSWKEGEYDKSWEGENYDKSWKEGGYDKSYAALEHLRRTRSLRAFGREFGVDQSNLSKYLKRKRRIPQWLREKLESPEGQTFVYNKMSDYYAGTTAAGELWERSPEFNEEYKRRYDELVRKKARHWWDPEKHRYVRKKQKEVRAIFSTWGTKNSLGIDYWQRVFAKEGV